MVAIAAKRGGLAGIGLRPKRVADSVFPGRSLCMGKFKELYKGNLGPGKGKYKRADNTLKFTNQEFVNLVEKDLKPAGQMDFAGEFNAVGPDLGSENEEGQHAGGRHSGSARATQAAYLLRESPIATEGDCTHAASSRRTQ